MQKISYWCLLALVCMPFFTVAQEADDQMISRIREEGFRHSQISFIAHHITDVSGSRLTNSPGFRRAATWIIGALQSWGLEHAGLEAWGPFGYGWSVEKTYAAMKAPYYSPLIAYPAPWSGSTRGLVSAPVLMVDRLDSAYIMENANSIRGAIVMVKSQDTLLHQTFKPAGFRYSDSALSRLGDSHMITPMMFQMFIPEIVKENRQEKLLVQAGAAALLEMSREQGDGAVFVDGFAGYDPRYHTNLTKLILEKEDYLKLERILQGGLEVKLDLDIDTKLYDQDLQGHNLIAEIPGTDPSLKSEVVMLGGHLDSWQSATGATDNGAGCIVMMEAVRILKALGVKPKRTIRLALWDGEEQGLLGSFQYVKKHFGDPRDMNLKPEQANISAYFNLDNGTGKIRGIYTQGNEAVVPVFTRWLEPFRDLGASTVTLHNTGSTDHLSFDAIGIPGFQFIQDPIDYETRTHHSNMDTYDHLMIADLQQAAVIVAAFVYNSAMQKEKLPRKPLPEPRKFIFDQLFP